jgi:simple sugar transport system permease protein
VPQIGEYFRVFVAYGIIAVALAIHAWQDRQMRKEAIREAVLTE